MVRRTGEARVEKYKDKIATGMIPNYEKRVSKADVRVFGTLAELETKVSALLTDVNVTGNKRVEYLNFLRKLWSAVRTGTLTVDKYQAMKAYWLVLGCDEDVLERIREIVAPSAPG